MTMLRVRWLGAIGMALTSLMSVMHAEPPATSYQVDKNSSRIYVKVMRTNRLGHNHGVEGKLASGSLKFGDKGDFTFDMTTFTADTAAAQVCRT